MNTDKNKDTDTELELLSDEDFLEGFAAQANTEPSEGDLSDSVSEDDPREETDTEDSGVFEEPEEVEAEKEEEEVQEDDVTDLFGSDTEDSPDEDTEPAQENQSTAKGVDYKEAYETIMAPFKANGKMIELHNVDEVRQLMQMGANYTKKMQEIAPYRRVITMLQNNDLLDESKLSYLIDLDKKNPAAIQQLVKQAEIDPLDLMSDNEEEDSKNTYVPTDYRVSEQEIQFKEYVDEISSTPKGQETIQVLNSMDAESKAQLWEHPQLMGIIHQQRESGLYDQIVAEIDRRRAFGQIPHNASFIEAYTHVGNELFQGNRNTGRTPVAKKAAAPRSQVSNNQAARAASTPKGTKRPAGSSDVLSNLSDDEFMAQFEKYQNRV